MPFSLPETLCRLGTNFRGAGECVVAEEAISVLDKVRRCSVVGDEQVLASRPSCILTDSLVPPDLLLYSDDTFKKGNLPIHCVSPSVVGGAIFDSGRVKFPVTVLYSKKSNAVVVHATSAPLAELELEFHDAAFKKSDWLTMALGDDGGTEFAGWWRDAATEARRTGVANTPQHLVSGASYTLVRRGVTALLSLRAPENETEVRMLEDHLEIDLCIFPKAALLGTVDKPTLVCFHARTDGYMEIPRHVMQGYDVVLRLRQLHQELADAGGHLRLEQRVLAAFVGARPLQHLRHGAADPARDYVARRADLEACG